MCPSRPFVAEYPESPTCLHGLGRDLPCAACRTLTGADSPERPTPHTALYAASLGAERPHGVTFDWISEVMQDEPPDGKVAARTEPGEQARRAVAQTGRAQASASPADASSREVAGSNPASLSVVPPRVIVSDSGCWLFQGALSDGYGTVDVGGKTQYVHRLAWQIWRGEIPPKRLICHTCDVRNCINPDHLFVGTLSDNMRDAVNKGRHVSGFGVWKARKTHCVRGHEYTPETVRLNKEGHRVCIICRRERDRTNWPRRKVRAQQEREGQICRCGFTIPECRERPCPDAAFDLHAERVRNGLGTP